MILVMDACTIINLLQSVLDEKYFSYIEKLFQIYITQIVFKEIEKNKHKNISQKDWEIKKEIDRIIYSQVRKYIYDGEDFNECHKVLKNATNYLKVRDGEFDSTALSLYLSRQGKEEFCEHLLKIYFVTDDSKAVEDFRYFFKINQIGQIIDSIDIITLLYLKESIPITKKDLLDYCVSLKASYNKTIRFLIEKIEKIEKHYDNDPIEQLILTELIGFFASNNASEKFEEIKRKKVFNKFKRKDKKFRELIKEIEEFLRSKTTNKIMQIEKRIKNLENIWKI